jgi:hypothetical protein
MTDLITIDGNTYDVPIVDMPISYETLDKSAKRTADGVLHREIIGIFAKYEILFGVSNANPTAYAALVDKLTEPVEFHTVILPTETGTLTATCYFGPVKHQLYRVRGSNKYYKGLSVSIIPKSPTRAPA